MSPKPLFRTPPATKGAARAVAAPAASALGVCTSYTIDCPPGMLHARKTRKRFTSVSAFDGYIGELRRVGRSVDFLSPTHAVLAPPDFPNGSGVLFMFADATPTVGGKRSAAAGGVA